MKTLHIEIPKGYEIDLEKSDLTKGVVAFKKIATQLPKTWEELNEIKGWYCKSNSEVDMARSNYLVAEYKSTFVTQEKAEASIALAQLSQLREVYRQGWIPDWDDHGQIKCTIQLIRNGVTTYSSSAKCAFLSFQTIEIRDEFLNNFGDLIMKARPLMS
jgi:hypothetical protein